MRKILVYMMLLIAVSAVASEVKWAKDFKSGMTEALRFNKPVLFISSRHTCKYCVILEETTLSDKKIVDKLNKEFVSIVSYSDEYDYMPRELYRPGTPAIWFLLPDGRPMYQPIMGALDAQNFYKALKVVEMTFKEYNEKQAKKNKGKKI